MGMSSYCHHSLSWFYFLIGDLIKQVTHNSCNSTQAGGLLRLPGQLRLHTDFILAWVPWREFTWKISNTLRAARHWIPELRVCGECYRGFLELDIMWDFMLSFPHLIHSSHGFKSPSRIGGRDAQLSNQMAAFGWEVGLCGVGVRSKGDKMARLDTVCWILKWLSGPAGIWTLLVDVLIR